MTKFIYAFSNEMKDSLLSNGYTLLKSNEEKKIFMFENKQDMCFDLNLSECVFSDVMTF